ncbi:MAG: EAL domain-containing protein [Acidobacteriota bacterium]|nr:EAL domain-containing protein [Acidobacteriota bacterium]
MAGLTDGGRRILAAAMVAMAAGTLLGTLLGAGSGSTALGAGELAGVAACGAGLALWTRRPGDGVAAPLLEASMVAGVAGATAWTLFVAPRGAGWGPASELVPLAVAVADVWLAWSAVRLLGERALKDDGGALVAGLSFLLLVDALVAGAALAGGRVPLAAGVTVVRACACVLCAAAVLRHPDGALEAPASSGRLPGAVLLAGVLATPGILAVRAAESARLSVPVVLGVAGLAALTSLSLLETRRRPGTESELGPHADALTGLVNRTLFEDRIDRAIARAERAGTELAVMFVDLDQFKLVNDSLGHSIGNELLKALAGRLEKTLRAEDTAARLGGDEFGVLLPEIADERDWTTVADKVLQVVNEPFFIHGRELVVSASIGVAVFPADGRDAMTLIDHADTAMYRAKAMGGGKRRYLPNMSTRSQMRLSIETNLRLAIERDELCLHYQPKVDRDLQVVGLEALVRWDHPRLGLIGPSGFVPLAEETGLIVPMGEWVLDTACRQARAWQETGAPPVPVAVNLSPRQLMTGNFESVVAAVLAEQKVDPSMIELEVTEGVFLGDQNAAREKLLKLRDMGVHCSIDDFGTGYSALAYLARLPIESLKIDRSFVQGIGTVLGDSLVEAIISLAHNLKVKVVAEGVESESQAQFLDTRGCEEFQGFLFGHPVAVDEIELLLRDDGAVRRSLARPLVAGITALAAPGPREKPVETLIERVFDAEDHDVDEQLVQAVLDALQAAEGGDRLRRRLRRLQPALEGASSGVA